MDEQYERLTRAAGRRARRKAKRSKIGRILLILIAAGILVGGGIWIFFLKGAPIPKESQSVFPDAVYDVPVHTLLIGNDSEGRPGIRREIQYIVIHETGNTADGANAKSHAKFLLNGGEGSTSWHYTVDDQEIYHHLPDDEVGWHAGDGRAEDGGNMCGIGVELCVNADGNFEKTFDNAARLTAYLVKSYHLSIDDVKQHADFMQKNCPETIRNEERWQEFLDLAQSYFEQE